MTGEADSLSSRFGDCNLSTAADDTPEFTDVAASGFG
jgi:hypothetical protein